MKIKLLLLVGIGFVPLGLVSQTAFLYNKGVMSVKGNNTATTLYIGGDFVAGHDDNTKCQITLSNSQTVLTGNFIHDLNTAPAANTQIFNFTDGGVSKFVFKGISQQFIKEKSNAYSATLKGQNYINFPTLVVENQNTVTLMPELAAKAVNLDLPLGRFVIDSRRAISSEIVDTIQTPATSTMMAHFMVDNKPTALNNPSYTTPGGPVDATLRPKFGAVQVNLVVDEALPEETSLAANDYRYNLVAMGSPFAKIKADYFFWNFLMIPKDADLIGGASIANPKKELMAGQGFITAIDLRGSKAADYDLQNEYEAAAFGERAKDRYEFSRFSEGMFKSKNNVFQADGWGGHGAAAKPTMAAANINDDAYSGEVLNYGDVPVSQQMIIGYNYYANPYTVPLNLDKLLTPATANVGWGDIVIGNATTNPTRDINNTVWILDPATSKARGENKDSPNRKLTVTSVFRVMKTDGSTYDTGTGDAATVIAPLQMFVLYSKTGAKTLTIPASARVLGKNALFLRSEPVANKLRDDFVFEVKDMTSGSSDKAAVVIRTPQDVLTNGDYQGIKKLILSLNSTTTTTRATVDEGTIAQSDMSIVYTKSSEGGAALESNVLGVPQSATSESTVLYVTPSLTSQNISIAAGRLATADRVTGIYLKDKVTNKEFDLFTGKTYTTASKPTDPVDRFTLRFTFATSGVENGGNNSESKSITSYYANGTLTVTGFDDADFGSTVSVYDIQGRVVAQAKVNDTSVEITEPFAPGAFIVKVVGNKSYAAKFLVK